MKEESSKEKGAGSMTRILLWLLIVIPPLLTLFLVDQYRFKTPHRDGWFFVAQYFSVADGEQPLFQVLLERHNEHLLPIAKIFYFTTLKYLGGAVGDLTYLTIAVSAGIVICLYLLARPQWNNNKPTIKGDTIWIMFLVSLAVFSTVQDYTWLWPFVFNNGLPFLWLTISMLIWQKPGVAWTRFTLTALLGLIAVASFGNGFIVWPGLWVYIWLGAPFKNEKERKQILIAWALAAVAVTTFALSGAGSEGRIEHLLSNPLLAVQYILALVGSGWSQGTPIEPRILATTAGLLFCGAWLLCVGRVLIKRDRDLTRKAAPWIVLGGCSLAVAGLVCAARLSRSIDPALTGRYITFCIYVSVSVLFLVPLVLKPKWMRLLIVPATLLIALQIANWSQGARSMRYGNAMFLQKEACIPFMGQLPWDDLAPLSVEQALVEPVLTRLIEEDRIKRVFVLDDLRLSGLKQGGQLSTSKAAFEDIIRRTDGKLEASGYAQLNDRKQPPELILLTWQTKEDPEMIFEIGLPIFPSDYFERSRRRKEFRSHYDGWIAEMSLTRLPKGKECILRAYAFDYVKRRLYPMAGGFRILDKEILGKLE